MKKIRLPVLSIILILLSGCTSNNSNSPEEVAKSLAVEPGYERRAEQISFSGFDGEISAATLYDNKLWFVSEQVLYSANPDGSNVREVFDDLPNSTQRIAFGAGGDVYISAGLVDVEFSVHVFTRDGREKFQIPLERSQQFIDLATLPGGTPAVLLETPSGCSLRALESESLGDVLGYDFPKNAAVSGMSFYGEALLLMVEEGLSVYSEDKLVPVFKWIDIEVVSKAAYVAGITEDADIIYLNFADRSLYITQSAPENSEKAELTLAVVNKIKWISPELETAVVAFNASNNKCKINIITFEALDQLNVKIIAGNIPDLILVSPEIPFETFAAKGLFEDLNPYFENDPDVAFLSDIHRTLATEDKLFRVSPGFLVGTLVGSSDFVGANQGWSFDEVKGHLAVAPKGATVFPAYWSKQSALIFLLHQNVDEFVDWESGRAFFDTPDFKGLLELISSHPEIPLDEQDDEIERLLDGRQLITHDVLSLQAFLYYDTIFDGKAVYKGFLSSTKHSGVILPGPYILSMTGNCTDKEGAWSFIRSALMPEKDYGYMPTVQSKFDLVVKLAMEEESNPLTQAQYDGFMNFLSGVDTARSYSIILSDIIEEEALAYFDGQKSLDEVCEIIQNRAQTYVSEQKK